MNFLIEFIREYGLYSASMNGVGIWDGLTYDEMRNVTIGELIDQVYTAEQLQELIT